MTAFYVNFTTTLLLFLKNKKLYVTIKSNFII